MKFTRLFFILAAFMGLQFGFAQEYVSGEKQSITKQVIPVERDSVTVPYTVKIYENAISTMAFDDADRGKVDQDRIPTPEYVSKLIFISNDFDKEYEKFLVVRYEREDEDRFELNPTEDGFVVKVNDREVQYVFDKGAAYEKNENKSFEVEEFNATR